MPNKRLHIIITEEAGSTRTLAIKKKTIYHTGIGIALLTLFLIAGTTQGFRYFALRLHADSLTTRLKDTITKLTNLQQEKKTLINNYESNIDELKREKDNLLEGSISRLDERSKVIQSVMDHIGVEIKIEEDPDHSGGPYTETDNSYLEKLIYRTDKYLEVLNKIPLGKPVSGGISSKYGYRSDPIVQKKAFHAGIDFRGRTGDKIYATADGIVKLVGVSKGRGRYVTISHKNGYETHFAHLSKQLVKKGDTIKRGQIIGLMGNSGRSTGSHLHYEIRYDHKTIDPMKYLQVANLSVTVNN